MGNYPDVESKYDEVMEWLDADMSDHYPMYSDLWRKAAELKVVSGKYTQESEWCQRVYSFATDLKDSLDAKVDEYLAWKREYYASGEAYLGEMSDAGDLLA